MPKTRPKRNDADYVRFPPYHAFTTPASIASGRDRRKLFGWILLAVVVVLVVLGISAALIWH